MLPPLFEVTQADPDKMSAGVSKILDKWEADFLHAQSAELKRARLHLQHMLERELNVFATDQCPIDVGANPILLLMDDEGLDPPDDDEVANERACADEDTCLKQSNCLQADEKVANDLCGGSLEELVAPETKQVTIEADGKPPNETDATIAVKVEDTAHQEHSHHEKAHQEHHAKLDGAFGAIFSTGGYEIDLEQPTYFVENYYHTTGWAQDLARSDRFMNITLFIISINAVFLGVDADWNEAEALYDAEWPFYVAENLFCTFFTFELVTRFMAFRRKRDCLRDGWFRFDAALVSIMVFETWMLGPALALGASGSGPPLPSAPLRLLRLFRLSRMARLLRNLPELITMVKGMWLASRAVCSSLLMVVLSMYTFAIIINMGMKQEDEINNRLKPRDFSTIPRTMWTLLMDGTFLDSPGIVLSALLFSGKPVCIVCCFVFMLFIILSAINVMNMLIGVLCEVVSAVAQAEKDEAAIKMVKDSILLQLKRFDNGDGMITKDELDKVMNDSTSREVLQQLNVDRLFSLQLQQVLFPKDDSEVPIKGIMELMLMCRGDLSVTVKHLASSQAAMVSTVNAFEKRVSTSLQLFNKRMLQSEKHIFRSKSGSVELVRKED